MPDQTRLLVVDDDADIRELLSAYLARYDMTVETAADGAGFSKSSIMPTSISSFSTSCSPAKTALSLCRRLRGTSAIPVIFLTSLDSSTDRVVGLELGADDYVVKPFDPRELLARIRTVLRRASDKGQAAAQSDIRRFAGWTLNVRSRELSQGDERIALSDAMYRLLLVFLDEPFAVLSREYLLRQTQGRDADVFDRSVDIQVSRLRGVLKDTGTSKIIKTVRGGGYMLSVDVEHDA